jgi:dipeptidyl aminopeptidase/acylaminoacyl peptidase
MQRAKGELTTRANIFASSPLRFRHGRENMPAKRQTLPYGTWPSPISPAMASQASRMGLVQAAGDAIYWSEWRPQEQGRQAIVRVGPDGRREDVLPKPFSARSRVHEYGGGEFLVAGDTVYFVNAKDQQVYALVPGRRPRRITEAPDTRFADLAHDGGRDRLIAVAEVHPPQGEATEHALPRNLLVAIALGRKPGEVTQLAAGRDFYAGARLSPDGGQLAWIAWDLPDMPWDSAALYVANVLDDGSLGEPHRIAGGEGSAVLEPEWGPDGHLYFAWDESGAGALYRWDGRRVASVRRERGAELWPSQWTFGSRAFALHPNGRYAAVFLERGMPLLEIGKLAGGEATQYRALQKKAARIDQLTPWGSSFAALVTSPVAVPAVMRIERGALKPVTEPPPAQVEARYISVGAVHEFRSATGKSHGIYYAPTSPTHRGPEGALPPALVLVHGGPTSMTDAGLKMRIQFFTSRGFAVLDLNYAGSTGYGRPYRQRLDGEWGIADVADSAAAARYLARQRLADKAKIAIAGGSAGGYTTLMALATTKAFAAGSSHYGVSDLGLLMEHTHKFESGYLHRLLGTTPEAWKEVCAQRSPLNLIDGISAPVILFQGLDDKVVPPEQSRLIAERLRARGIDVEYHEFEGEAHGFRRSETIVAVLEAELAFLQRVLELR